MSVDYARIDALIAKLRAWQAEGRCYACGADGTHRVSLAWMGEGGRPYCAVHAAEWARAGWPQLVSLESS